MLKTVFCREWFEAGVAGKKYYNASCGACKFLEYEDVSKRKRILDLCPLSGQDIRELLNAFYANCRWVPIYFLWRPNILDEGDNFVIELALAGNATHIVTNNIRDFQNAELLFPGLSIVRPEEFLGGN